MAIYLDYAAATPVDERVLSAMSPFWADRFYNPSSLYKDGYSVQKSVDEFRHTIARKFEVRAQEVVFTAGGTEADNLAVHGVARQYENAHIVISLLEHPAVSRPAEHYSNSSVLIKPSGQIDIDDLRQKITGDTVLVSIGIVDSEIGIIQPIKKIADIVQIERERRKKIGIERPIYLHTDASQAFGWLNLQPNRLGVDMMTINSAKIYGPKQMACLYVSRGISLSPLVDGGGHEHSLRSGTENVPTIAGFARAVELTDCDKADISRIAKIRDDFETQLAALFPSCIINGKSTKRLANFSNFSLHGQDGEALVIQLDEMGIQVATGAACSANYDEPSRSLLAIGRSVNEANASLRVSLSKKSTEADLQALLDVLNTIVNTQNG